MVPDQPGSEEPGIAVDHVTNAFFAWHFLFSFSLFFFLRRGKDSRHGYRQRMGGSDPRITFRAEGSKSGVAPAHPSVFAPPAFFTHPRSIFVLAHRLLLSKSTPRQNDSLNAAFRGRSGILVVCRSKIRLLCQQDRFKIQTSFRLACYQLGSDSCLGNSARFPIPQPRFEGLPVESLLRLIQEQEVLLAEFSKLGRLPDRLCFEIPHEVRRDV